MNKLIRRLLHRVQVVNYAVIQAAARCPFSMIFSFICLISVFSSQAKKVKEIDCTDLKVQKSHSKVCQAVVDPMKFKRPEFERVDCTGEFEDGYHIGVCKSVDLAQQAAMELKLAKINHSVESVPRVRILSGLLMIQQNECAIDFGKNTENIACTLKFSEDANRPYVELDFSKLSLSTVPICVFDGGFQRKTTKKIETYVSLHSSNRINLVLNSLRKGEPKDVVASFICHIIP